MSREDLPEPDERPELGMRPAWRLTWSPCFPVAAMVEGHVWVLRLNGFPDHPMWTLFVDGTRRFDVEAMPESWGRPLRIGTRPAGPRAARRMLAGVREYTVYGSEVGDPCEDPFCCG
ncbi:hypothetical protein [Nocardia sp. NPDC057668]|uniref:hypothetical protein n=1 Tax=Nocardia sp. NPDC057668 TaxID=3346202 RepID=UPI00366C15EF